MDTFEQRHEKGISNMGELLLKGYIMSAESCPDCNCVLFKKTKNSPLFCPICDNINKEPQNISKKEDKNKLDEKDNVKLNEIKDNFSKQSDSINNKMSELLLAGWTLTNNNCPFCIGIPLMKNKEKQQLCVKCEKNFISEEEAKNQGMTINDDKLEEINKNIVQPENIKITKDSLESDKRVVQHTLEKEIVPPIKKEKREMNYSNEVEFECTKTTTALLHQLSLLRSKLENINEHNDSMVQNIQYTINICDAISSVCNAINACNSILNK